MTGAKEKYEKDGLMRNFVIRECKCHGESVSSVCPGVRSAEYGENITILYSTLYSVDHSWLCWFLIG